MSSAQPKNAMAKQLVDQLRDPLKLRFVLCLVILGGWYFLFYAPLSDQMTLTQGRIVKERQRIDVARQIEGVRKSLASSKERVPPKSDLNELIEYVMGRIHSSPLKLIDLKPDKAKSLGPYDALTLRLTIEGTYREIDEFLAWTKSERRLLRIESVGVVPAKTIAEQKKSKGPMRLAIQLTLSSLVEHSSHTPQRG
jgi:Tfp pilus assembly protein PilO